MNIRQRQTLTTVARGRAMADLYVRGGTLLNVYTGELYPANVAIKGDRVAYVGLRDDMVGERTRVLDVSGRVLCPGYIDPHAHPAHLVTPSALACHVVPLGTTAVFADTLQFWELGGRRAFRVVADALARSPLRFYWMIRSHAQSRTRDEHLRYPLGELARALKHPAAVAVGEVTRWPDAWGGQLDMLNRLALADGRGRRVEGHTAGTSGEKMAAIAAAGFTSDHEPITASEVLARARNGIVAATRPGRPARRAEGGAGAGLAPDAHVRRLDAGVHPGQRLHGPRAPHRARPRRPAHRRLPHGHVERGDLLRARG